MRPFILTLALALLTLALASGLAGAHHEPRVDNRLVAPHGLPVLTHIPVVAGYEPFPTPQHCLTGAAADPDVYDEDFEGAHGYALAATSLAPTAQNLWHVTTLEIEGGAAGHSQQNRLYFGQDQTGNIRVAPSSSHVAGTIYSPAFDLPEGDAFLSFATKWETEWLKGYDHMWVEMLDVGTGDIHLLCTANAVDRADGSSSGDLHEVGSCSPILAAPCPALVDPEWETRWIAIPSYLQGSEVRLRFTFDSSDDVANTFMGWMVDDVRVGTGLAGV